ncbi:hypothetical protein SAMN05216548_109165 [Faunimonas pinastri]|uniref:Uncharacterized protein n=1 Tax=Faunimonas pinastri TaxID=1855383 RepID=A0A1H9KDE0_9HYPH|nr:hypothetical protein [Faunimonas pinastri]SEQ97160.1 hypothetical protein SAMN05216548_109165 [Faunimonas pinastri]
MNIRLLLFLGAMSLSAVAGGPAFAQLNSAGPGPAINPINPGPVIIPDGNVRPRLTTRPPIGPRIPIQQPRRVTRSSAAPASPGNGNDRQFRSPEPGSRPARFGSTCVAPGGYSAPLGGGSLALGTACSIPGHGSGYVRP